MYYVARAFSHLPGSLPRFSPLEGRSEPGRTEKYKYLNIAPRRFLSHSQQHPYEHPYMSIMAASKCGAVQHMYILCTIPGSSSHHPKDGTVCRVRRCLHTWSTFYSITWTNNILLVHGTNMPLTGTSPPRLRTHTRRNSPQQGEAQKEQTMIWCLKWFFFVYTVRWACTYSQYSVLACTYLLLNITRTDHAPVCTYVQVTQSPITCASRIERETRAGGNAPSSFF
jgi:hypothetical protein